MELVLIKDIIVPVATVVISGIGAYIGAKRGKTSAYREAIYSKQMEACSEIASATYEVLYNVAFPVENAAAYMSVDNFEKVCRKWMSYLPDEVEAQVNQFSTTARCRLMLNSNLTSRYESGESWSPADEHEWFKSFDSIIKEQKNVLLELRKLIGTEALSKESNKMFTSN